MKDLKEIMRALVSDMVHPDLHTATVVSVDESDMTCEVDLTTAANIPGARLRAAIDSVAKGLLIVPKVGSVVVIARLEGKIEGSCVVSYTQIQSINIVTEDLLKLNGDSEGGLVVSSAVSAEDNTIKQDLNTLKSKVAAWIPTPNDGGAGLKAILADWFTQHLEPKAPTEYESNKVKHGS